MLFTGGTFTMSGSLPLNHIAAWNIPSHSWLPLGSGTDNQVLTIASNGSRIYAGGIFHLAGGKLSDYLGSYESSASLSIILPVVMR
ncbi:MAG: hypothetical protein A2Y88_11645 [Chloroflexi bacterium RBG_13_48_10]|nr:MAG: hypothetical protein A2Y88_11645 [Chloroflexi bacterium RBG_13_48_10]